MNKITNKFFLAGNKVMPEMNLRQHKGRIQKFKETEDSRYSAVIIRINLNKTATQAFLQISLSFMCLETYTKNPLSSDLLKSFFELTVKPMLFGLSEIAYFIWRRRFKNALPLTSELYA